MKNIINKFKINSSMYFMLLIAMLAGYIKHVLIIMCIIVIHELGHVFFTLLFKIGIDSIEIYPFGGLTKINKRIHERIYKDILISMGGIIFQSLLYFLFVFLYKNNLIVTSTFNLFIKYNKNVLIFNMLPIIPLDGSKLLLSILSKFLSFKKSYILMIIVSVISLMGFISYNIFYKLNDLIIYFFLLVKLGEICKNYKYVMNKFYLERIMYDHYYNTIINDEENLDNLRIDKYYYFYDNKKYINEKEFIKKNIFDVNKL